MEQKIKVLVIGCNGMAGHVIKSFLDHKQKYDVIGIARGIKESKKLINLDVREVNELQKVLSKYNFDVVINCVGILNKKAEDNPELAIWINSYFPHLLSSYGLKFKFKLIHISTDCVFSGKTGNYTESSYRDGFGFYAQSKALGEVCDDKNLTIRTSIIGPELNKNGIGLFNWFMCQSNEVYGYMNAIWTGITTVELAEGIDSAIEQNIVGLHHFVNNTKISKYDLLKILNKVFRNNEINVKIDNDYVVDKSLICTRKDFNFTFSSYADMIKKMKNWMKIFKVNYNHYQFK